MFDECYVYDHIQYQYISACLEFGRRMKQRLDSLLTYGLVVTALHGHALQWKMIA